MVDVGSVAKWNSEAATHEVDQNKWGARQLQKPPYKGLSEVVLSPLRYKIPLIGGIMQSYPENRHYLASKNWLKTSGASSRAARSRTQASARQRWSAWPNRVGGLSGSHTAFTRSPELRLRIIGISGPPGFSWHHRCPRGSEQQIRALCLIVPRPPSTELATCRLTGTNSRSQSAGKHGARTSGSMFVESKTTS